jgi:PBSX family phage terminase large subunit
MGVWYRRFIAGEWCLAEGAIFDFFDTSVHSIQRPPANAKFHIVGCDIGFTNPSAFVLIGYNDQVSPPLWVEDEYYFDSKKAGRQKTDAEYAADLTNFVAGRNVKFIYIDPAAASFKVEMRKAGIGIPIRDADNDVTEGIKTVSSYLSMGDLKICRNCRNLIGEVQEYCWDSKAAERGEDAPIKRNDHALDALRYALFFVFWREGFIEGGSARSRWSIPLPTRKSVFIRSSAVAAGAELEFLTFSLHEPPTGRLGAFDVN